MRSLGALEPESSEHGLRSLSVPCLSQRRRQHRAVDNVTVGMTEQKLPELLGGPLGGRVLSDVAVQDPARSNFHCDEDVQHAKARRNRNEEVTGDNGVGMIPNENGPALAGASPWLATLQILADGSRRTRMPSFSDSSFAILSSPQIGFSWAIWRTSSRIFLGSAGRPRLRDFHRQNIRNAVRCHVMNVSGFAIPSAPRQSKNFASAAIEDEMTPLSRVASP